MDGAGNAVAPSAGTGNGATHNTGLPDDCWLECAYNQISSDCYFQWRMPQKAWYHGYNARVTQFTDGRGWIKLMRDDSGSLTPTSTQVVPQPENTLRIEHRGATITVYLNGAQVLVWTDPNPLTGPTKVGPYTGMVLYSDIPPHTDLKLRSFKAGGLATGGGAIGVAPAVSVKQGSATVTYTEVTAAAGKKTPRSVVTTSYVETVTAAGSKTQKSTVTTSYVEALSSAGKRTPKSTLTTTALQTLSTVGKRTPKAQATTAHAWAPAATGAKPVVGVKQGSAVVNYVESLTVAGKRIPKGSNTVSALWTPVASGKKTQKGTATTSYVEAVPSAPGKRTPKSTVTTTTLHTTGVTGKRTPKATVTTAHSWVLTANGVKPIVGAKQGFATTSWTLSTAAVGKRTPKSAPTVAHLWTLSITGKKLQKGTAATSYADALTVAGKRFPKSTVVTTYTELVAAAGRKAPRGAGAAIVHTWSMIAQGYAPLVGYNTGSALTYTAWAPAAVGKRAPKGSRTISVPWTPSATGKKIQAATAATSYLWTPGAQGKKLTNGAALITYVEVVSLAGQRVPKGSGDSDYWFSQVALGLAGVTGHIEGIWNGLEVVEMQYGDKGVIEWLMVPT